MTAATTGGARLSGAWIQNPKWHDCEGLLSGTLTRQEEITEGKLPMSQSFARAKDFVDGLLRETSRRPDGKFSEIIKVVGANQVHEDHVEVVNGFEDLGRARRLTQPSRETFEIYEFPKTDALITTLPNIILVIQTADCLPILYWDRTTWMVGACHCGWRGLYERLASKTARLMIEQGARAETLEAWIGPGICFENYEVGGELVGKFREKFPHANASGNGTHLNLSAVAVDELTGAGLRPEHIVDSGECTFGAPDRYHSYRKEGPGAGRLLTMIGRVQAN